MRYDILRITEKELPNKLKNIKDAPERLYLIGNRSLLYKESFGIVGTRRITEYGISACKYFAEEFAYRRIPVVSGMAIGTDSIAHSSILENRGETIAILGSGFNNIYPEENIELFNKIIETNGLIITEYESFVKPNKENFPRRNRLISAISEGILIIEAGYRSGTSITARYAKEQGKTIFAVPRKNR